MPGFGDEYLDGRRPVVDDGGPGHSATMYSTMLHVKVDRSEGVPLHDQVAAEIRHAHRGG